MQRFMGMTKPVAEVLANKVFCILPDPKDDSPRMTAAEFGAWVKNLPSLLGSHSIHRTVSSSSTGHRLSLSIPISHRPASRQASGSTATIRTPAIPVRSLSRAPSLEPPFEREELSTVIDQEDNDQDAEGMNSRSTSTNKRRKRGARKGKGAMAASPPSDQDTLDTLAVASQSLAREISKASKSSAKSKASAKPFEPVSMYAMPIALLPSPRPAHTTPTASTSSPAPVTKKPSKWKLSFGKNSGSVLANSTPIGRISPVEEASPPTSLDLSPNHAMATTASNVTNLLMGLNAPPVHATTTTAMTTTTMPASPPKTDPDMWSRGRRARDVQGSSPRPIKTPSRSPGYALSTSPPQGDTWAFHDRPSVRAVSPNSTRSGRPLGSSASSVVSSNWRSSMSTSSSAGTSTSAFTRYSNSSARSISTTATSVSSASWRTTSVKPPSTYSSSSNGYPHGNLPKNIKSKSCIHVLARCLFGC